ncbi:MAG: SBBP repeat-containing protein [Polyangiaceae bacterium]|nr:SBBP repeat-containing protein [Polyangiaceae bacterium]
MWHQFFRYSSALAAFAAFGAAGCLLPDYVEAEGVCEPGAQWVRSFGGVLTDTVKAASSDVCGGVTVGGSFQTFLRFGDEAPLEAKDEADGYVARFDAAGNTVWVTQISGDGAQYVSSLTTDIFGGAIAAGELLGSMSVAGADPVTLPDGQQAAFVTRFDLRGAHHWTRILRETTGMRSTAVCGVAADSSGNVTVAGDFRGSVDFGGQTRTGDFDDNIFVAHYDSDGNLVWVNSYQTPRGIYCNDIAVDNEGNILVTGSYGSAINFGGGEHEGPGEMEAGQLRFFVLKLNSVGDRVWSQGTNDVNQQEGFAIAADEGGNVIVAGVFRDKVPLGGTLVSSNGGGDIFIKKLDPLGTSLWGVTFGGASEDTVGGLAIGPSGQVVIHGETPGTIAFDQDLSAQVTDPPTVDPFLATLDGFDGKPLSSRMFHGPGDEYVTAVALDPEGFPLVAGTFGMFIDLGIPSGQLSESDMNMTDDFFVAKLKP